MAEFYAFSRKFFMLLLYLTFGLFLSKGNHLLVGYQTKHTSRNRGSAELNLRLWSVKVEVPLIYQELALSEFGKITTPSICRLDVEKWKWEIAFEITLHRWKRLVPTLSTSIDTTWDKCHLDNKIRCLAKMRWEDLKNSTSVWFCRMRQTSQFRSTKFIVCL